MRNKKLSVEEKVTFMQDTLARIIGFIQNCDTKASIVLAVIGIAFSSISFSVVSNDGIRERLIGNGNNWLIFLYIISIGFVLVGIFFLIKVLSAKLGKDINVDKSMIYFKDIADYATFNEYDDKLEASGYVDILNDLRQEVYENAKICKTKYLTYNKGLKISVIGLLMNILVVIYIFFVV